MIVKKKIVNMILVTALMVPTLNYGQTSAVKVYPSPPIFTSTPAEGDTQDETSRQKSLKWFHDNGIGNQTRPSDAPPEKEVCETAKSYTLALDIDMKLMKAKGTEYALGPGDMWLLVKSGLERNYHMSPKEAVRNIVYFNSRGTDDMELASKCGSKQSNELKALGPNFSHAELNELTADADPNEALKILQAISAAAVTRFSSKGKMK